MAENDLHGEAIERLAEQFMIRKLGGSIGRAWYCRIGRLNFSLKAPEFPVLFSERHRLGVRVLPLLRGWRINVRRIAHA